MIKQGIQVETFSFIFKDAGTYVFESAESGAIMIVSVVETSKTCSNSVNGIGIAEVTE